VFLFIWLLWLYKNDKVSNDTNSSLTQVISTGELFCYVSLSSLESVEKCDMFTMVSRRLENTTINYFTQHGNVISGLDLRHLRCRYNWLLILSMFTFLSG
jgi:hypothetical protein